MSHKKTHPITSDSCHQGYTRCGDQFVCAAHLCNDGGTSDTCGQYNSIKPDGTFKMGNQMLNYFCAADSAGNYPVDRSALNVSMGQKSANNYPFCCVQEILTQPYDCLNGGVNRSDGSCDCSSAVETLTDCSHSGGIGNKTYNKYNGSGSGSDGRPGGKSFTVQYTGKMCEIPGKLPDNFVKWFHNTGEKGEDSYYITQTSCQVNRDCLGDTTQCKEDNYFCESNNCTNNGTICGTNINGLDHKCTT